MNIGLFTDTYPPEVNGVAASTMMLCEELRRRGHRVFVITPHNPDHLAPQTDVLRLPSLPFIALPERRISLFYHPHMAKIMKTTGLDIVHTQSEFSMGIFGRMMAKKLNIPHVHTYHTIYEDYVHYVTRGFFDGQSKKVARTVSRMYCDSCRRVIVPSEKTRRLLLSYGVERPIDIIPTGIDTSKFTPQQYSAEERAALRATLGLRPEHRVVLSIGRIAKEKNIDEIIANISPLFAKHHDARLLIVGGGPHTEVLRELAQAQGIADKVIFAGERPWAEIGRYYALGDVFIAASTSETQGLTYIEAMSAGLPVVARKDPVIEGVVDNEKSGLLFEESSQIVPCLERALFDAPLRETLVVHALQKAEENSVATFGDRVETSYHAALNSAPAH